MSMWFYFFPGWKQQLSKGKETKTTATLFHHRGYDLQVHMTDQVMLPLPKHSFVALSLPRKAQCPCCSLETQIEIEKTGNWDFSASQIKTKQKVISGFLTEVWSLFKLSTHTLSRMLIYAPIENYVHIYTNRSATRMSCPWQNIGKYTTFFGQN